jgi:hypothetical protein
VTWTWCGSVNWQAGTKFRGLGAQFESATGKVAGCSAVMLLWLLGPWVDTWKRICHVRASGLTHARQSDLEQEVVFWHKVHMNILYKIQNKYNLKCQNLR